ncbi:Vgb family protein [Klenkia soli]|uniref:Vgb family protein n=1 Tax=Klenkia soli TaxID=1052260 RepID=UPI0010422CD5|nr:virginiamycin B lyase [Klenkia soli]
MDEVAVGTAGDGPYAVVETPDGALWTTLPFSGRVARVRFDGSGARVDHLDAGGPAARPSVLAVDAAGEGVWVTCTGDQRLRLVGPGGVLQDVGLPAGTDPYGIAGAGGDLLVAGLGGALLRIRDGGVVAAVDLPPGSFPGAVAVAADGAVWCTLNQADALARWVPGSPVELHPTGPAAAPVGICPDDSGGIWWTEIGAGRIGHRTSQGVVSAVDLPGTTPRPHAVADDGAGGCWVTAWGQGALLHVYPERGVTSLDLGTGSEPHGLAVAADGSVRVALESGTLVRVVAGTA